MMNKKVFSIPLNPKLSPEQLQQFARFLIEHKDFIYDVYFTCRIEPFMQDAMGDVFVNSEDYEYAATQALILQEHTGIPVSATFNNIEIPPTQQNLDTFIKNFKPLYDKGIRIATIPHTHWMATGQIKRAFPELFVKNTILRDVRVASEIVNLAKYGFDYINLDRDLMRDRDTLLRLKQAKEWIKKNLNKEIKYSLLANEGCKGGCPMMVEHFQFNNNREGTSPQYFNDPISRVSCPKWDVDDPSTHLKTANIPPWKEDWEEFLNELGIDVFKMHGRESIQRLAETFDIVRRWAKDEEILYDNFDNYLQANNLLDRPIDAWRKKIRNCKFDCWECHFCDDIYNIKSEISHTDLVKYTAQSITDSGVPSVSVNIPGLTSPRVQTLLNTLAKKSKFYMEVGSSLGSTFCSVLKDNTLDAVAIDNWKESIQPKNSDRITLPDNKKTTFESNVAKYKGNNSVDIIDDDIFNADIKKYNNKIDFWFYDGPHTADETSRAVQYYSKCFSDETILVFDDANWMQVVEGARHGISKIDYDVSYEKMILNQEEDNNGWWNGLYVVVLSKKQIKVDQVIEI